MFLAVLLPILEPPVPPDLRTPRPPSPRLTAHRFVESPLFISNILECHFSPSSTVRSPPFQDEAYRPCFPTQGSLAPTTAQLPQESANLSKSSCPVFQFSGMPFLILPPAAPPFLDESIDRALCSRGLRSSPSLIPRKEWCCRNPLSDFPIYWNVTLRPASIRLIP